MGLHYNEKEDLIMADYKLVFEESFDYTGKPNPELWDFEVGEKWANNESQCYIDSLDNCYVADGSLHIIATKHDTDTCKYRSARISTKHKKHFKYGRFVIRAKMPKGKGAWPAIWFLGTKKEHRWPKIGEIDLLEFAGNRPDQVTCAIHTKAYNHTIQNDIGAKKTLTDASEHFHDYILEWSEEELIFLVDYEEVLRVTKKLDDTHDQWPFDDPYYMIINLAVGGWYGGPIDDEDLPFHFEVAFIRYFEKI